MDSVEKYNAFISYRYKSDGPRANELHHFLLDKSLKVFYNDFSLPYGKPWRKEFLSAIHGCQIFLPLISRTLLESFENNSGEDFVLMEWDCAAELLLSNKIIVFPIFCCVSPDGITRPVFNSDGITLPDVPTIGCTRSAKEIWELFQGNNGLYVDFVSRNEKMHLAAEIDKILQTHGRYANSRGEAIPPLSMREYPSTYIDREDIWSKLEELFKSNKVCCLRGYGGSGKTFASNVYAFRMVEGGSNVGWIKADSEEAILEDYRKYSHWALRSYEKPEDLNWIANNKLDELVIRATLKTSRKADLLILDNVKIYSHVKSLINQSVYAGIKILITCRISMGSHSEIIMKNPSEDICIGYLRKSLAKRGESDEDYKKIVDLTNQFPLRLFIAASYLSKNEHRSVSYYIEKIHEKKKKMNFSETENEATDSTDDIYPEVSFSMDTIISEQGNSHEFLLVIAKLDPDLIITRYLKESIENFCELDSLEFQNLSVKISELAKSFDDAIDVAIRYGLIEAKSKSTSSISIHRCIQAEIRQRVISDSHVKYMVNKITNYYNRITKSIQTLIAALNANSVVEASLLLQKRRELYLNCKFKVSH
ncbi:hypothetical protein HK096_007338 [Nowakowskiella sp. JEL0078]|nr:hypothetical protein HK096_007338 [Nowakowskiella sp. JEL0078]